MSGTAAPSVPRWSLAIVSTLQAALFVFVGRYLPWGDFAVFAVLAVTLGALHAIVALLALAGIARRAIAWRVTSFAALLFLGYVAYAAISSGLYVVALYAGVGTPLAVAMGAVLLLFASFTVPTACWGIARTGGLRPRKATAVLGSATAVLIGLGLAFDASAARGERVLHVDATRESVSAAIAERFGSLARRRPFVAPLLSRAPSKCPHPIGPGLVTAFANFSATDGKPTNVCVDGRDLDAALDELARAVGAVYVGGPIAVDVVREVQRLPSMGPYLGAFSIRPARDGVCLDSACLTPHQLVEQDQFTKLKALTAFDTTIGVSAEALRTSLGAAPVRGFDGLVRFETLSYWVEPTGDVVALDRMRPVDRPLLVPANVDRGVDAGVEYILHHQDPDGRYHYLVDPFTGDATMGGFGVPRQAGTTLALCETAMRAAAGDERDRGSQRFRAKESATRSLAYLATLEQSKGDVGGLVYPKGKGKIAPLGGSALSMIAFLTCRPLVGDRFDATITHLGNGFLAMIRADGQFAPSIDMESGRPVDGQMALYTGGQGILALVLWEQATGMSKPGELATQIDKVMDYTAGKYWSLALKDFFYLEENWHCLAARAALSSHRRDAYERFCVDYMKFKKRLILEASDTDEPDYVGGVSFGTLVPPYPAATAGFAEALVAVLEIERARGLDELAHADEGRLERILGFLLRHQISADTCRFCTPRAWTAGGVSGNDGWPVIRIDFVQHNLAALFHGGEALWRGAPVPPALESTGAQQPREAR